MAFRADSSRTNSDLKASEYATPVLGLIFLKFADNTFRNHEAAIAAEHTRDLKAEDERHVREGLTEDELEIYDLIRKDDLTVDETLRVKLAARRLLNRLLDGDPRVLVQDWFRDSRTQASVGAAVAEVLNSELPSSYDRAVFKQKCDRVFDTVLDSASHGRKSAA